MSKSINSSQSDMLLLKMQGNPEIASGFVKENKNKITAFWKQLTLELNSAGPPIKSEFEWKKVWTDQKRYVRKKASQNRIYEKGTGGGPNKTKKFSPSEEAIFQLVGMKTAVEGVVASSSFGLHQPRKPQTEIETYLSEAFYESNGNEEVLTDEIEEIATDSIPPPVPSQTIENSTPALTKRCEEQKKKLGKVNAHQVLMDELEVQKTLCGKVDEAIGVMKEHNNQMEKSMKKLYRSLDSIHYQQKEHLKEQKRHNHEMKKLRKEEIESKIKKNQKIIELEDQKIRVMRGKENM